MSDECEHAYGFYEDYECGHLMVDTDSIVDDEMAELFRFCPRCGMNIEAIVREHGEANELKIKRAREFARRPCEPVTRWMVWWPGKEEA